ncbi:hypothetical protein HZB04_02225 [Candidatus Wolfebacteria bacterium]|nr:hypothetical protein [Candidatus Wolfebacteria bacterium]
MKEKSIKNKTSGQSVLEVLVALTVLAISILGGFFLAHQSQSFSTDTEFSQKALYLAQQGIEISRGAAKTNFSGLISSSSTSGKFSQETIVSDIDARTKKIISRVSWKTDSLKSRKIELSTILTDWKSINAPGVAGGGGGSPPSGNWSSPATLSSLDIGPGNEGTDIEVKGSYAYLSSVASDINKPDLFIFDISNSSAPVIVSQTNFGIKGINNINIFGNYLYAVSSDNSQEFLIIDIGNPAAPVKLSSLNLSGDNNGISVFYKNGFAYVGRASGAPQEFVAVDVSNPLSPQYYSGLTGVGGEINDIFVLNNYAYLGTEDNGAGLTMVDISNSSNLQRAGSLNIGEHAYGIFAISQSSVYVGGKTKFYIVDASNPANISVKGSVNAGDKVQDVAISGNLAFLATSNSTKEFQVIDISSSTNPTLYSYYNFPQSATGVDYLNNLVYLSVRSNDALRIITSSP